MERRFVNSCFSYAIVLSLVGSIFSMVIPFQPSFATHSDIEVVEVSDTNPDPGDDVTISGVINDAQEDDDVEIIIHEPEVGSDNADTTVDNDDGDFSESYSIPDSADDGIYEVEVNYESEDPTYGYFLIDEDDDPAPTFTDEDTYDAGQTVEITGEVKDPDTGEDEVDIKVLDPEGNDIGPGNIDMNSDDTFDYDLDLENDAHTGVYAIIVEYVGDEAGWAVFEVTGESGTNEITAQLGDTSPSPGDEVVITGSVVETDVVSGEEVTLEVEDPNNDIIEDDNVEPENDGAFVFRFDLDEEAEAGTYTVTLTYTDYEDKTLTFTVSTGSGGSGGGSGSGSDSGLTARLSETELLAGEMLTVSGVVPSIEEDPVNISVLRPDGRFINAYYPEPDSDKRYTATFRLPSTLEEDENYSVVVSYDSKEVEVFFDITGTASGTGGPVTVETDKASYTSGSTVRISGEIASDTLVEGEQIALQVYNPDNAPYRFDPITPESDGTYSYSMAVGGPLGVSGEWKVKVTYSGESAETTFDLTGGAPSSPRFNLIVGDLTFPIEYQSDGTIKNMFVRPIDEQLVISLEADEDGTLTIELPREVIDAVQGDSDIEYVVVATDIDTGEEEVIEVTESSTDDDSRTLVIDYPGGTDLIEIQGTTVVPEFGAMTAIVLALAILSMIAFTAGYSGKLGTLRFR